MEDYNTSTLPHIKYYDMEAWEREDYNKQQARNAKKRARTRTEFNDEDAEIEARRCVHGLVFFLFFCPWLWCVCVRVWVSVCLGKGLTSVDVRVDLILI